MKLLILALAVSIHHPHTSGIHSVDTPLGHDTGTASPAQGLIFLDVPLTAGMSWNQINNEFLPGSGFRWATYNEVIGLVNTAGFWPPITETSWYGSQNHIVHSTMPIDHLVTLLGPTHLNEPQRLIRGFTGDPFVNGKVQSLFLSDVADGCPECYDESWNGSYSAPDGSILDFVERFHYLGPDAVSLQTGGFLVQAIAIPEPPGWAIWSILYLAFLFFVIVLYS